MLFFADRDLQRNSVCPQTGQDRVKAPLKRSTGTVELVDKADTRNAVFIGLTPNRLGLRLNASNAVEHSHSTVKNAKRTLNFHREVHVPRRINDVDAIFLAVTLPEAGRGRGRDRDAAFLFLLHPVHRRGTFVNLADLMGNTGIKKDTFGRRGLARINVGHDPDVSEFV
ncbi:MAG: hypothetical protein JFAIHJKO_02245 [Pyrinomonadaceae bacterium]|nr:hypothetical protein [Pyrinomonadaceae bacterium]